MTKNPDQAGPLGEPAVHDYLALLRSSLAETIAPDVQSDRARGLLDMALTLIDHLIVRSGSGMPEAAERQARLDAVACALAGQEAVDGQQKSLEQLIAETIAAGADVAALGHVRTALIVERDFLERIGALEAEAARAPEKRSSRPFGGAEISAYLSKRYGGPVSVTAIGSPIGGFSKDVFVLTLDGAARPADRIVIRRDLPDGPLEGTVGDEFAVLKAAQAHGVPVAAPLWLEQDPAVFGGPTICLGFVEGAPVADARGQISAPQAVAGFRALARIAGQIHAMDPIAAGLLAPGETLDAQPYALRLLADFEEQWKRRRLSDNVVLAAAFAWMRAHVPAEPVRAAIVHGDCSLRNLMMADGVPTALLDWETWHLGDPAEDLAYVRDEVEAFMPWAEFMTEYRAAGGPDVSEDRLAYWAFWRELRGSITSFSMMDAVPKGQADIRSGFGGLYFTRILLAKLADRLQGLLQT